jgi:hypothetical protein
MSYMRKSCYALPFNQDRLVRDLSGVIEKQSNPNQCLWDTSFSRLTFEAFSISKRSKKMLAIYSVHFRESKKPAGPVGSGRLEKRMSRISCSESELSWILANKSVPSPSPLSDGARLQRESQGGMVVQSRFKSMIRLRRHSTRAQRKVFQFPFEVLVCVIVCNTL